MFGLKPSSEEERAERFIPTFRTLFPYFARLHEDGAFLEPYKVFSQQQLWNQQVAISFLLGLDWRIPQGMQVIRAKERTIRQLRQVLEDQDASDSGLFPRSDDLQAQLTVAVNRAANVKKDLADYRINPEYRSLEVEADRLTAQIARTLDEDTWDRETVSALEQALAAEAPPDPVDLHRLYDEALVELPSSALKRFDDVRAFHESVLRNRQSYLQTELGAARTRLAGRADIRRQDDARRAEVMAVLSSTGALDQFTQLQAELGRLEGQAEMLHIAGRSKKSKNGCSANRTQTDVSCRPAPIRRSPQLTVALNLELEAPPGFEPGMEVLQTSALPLGDGAGRNSDCTRRDPAAA
jgi:uncharacterized protein YydD (DUF2326 family)